MKKRILKKRNKKTINSILEKVSYGYSINKRRFGNGYFMFTFPDNSICWFWLDEFPDWKFGIWLNEDNSYDIFGEARVQIDKFKPSRATLSKNNVIDFMNELKKVENSEGEWKRYHQYTEQYKKEEEISKEVNQKRLEVIIDYIHQTQKEYDEHKVNSFLQLKDRNTKAFSSSPRYDIEEYAETSEYFDTDEGKERSKKLYEDLCNIIPYTGKYTDEKRFLDIDEFLFDNEFIKNEQDEKDREILFDPERVFADV